MSRPKRFAALLAAAVFLAAASPLLASKALLYFEVQGVGGYSSAAKKAIFYSSSAMDAMQKPSLGFDYVQRFSGPSGDFAVLAVQARLAWNREGGRAVEPQLYNAYLKFKTKPFDFWLGHAVPRFGMAAALDSHAALLQPLAMSGFGFDRDWGVGLERDTAGGGWGVSLTTGSGMSAKFSGGYFLAGRIQTGVLNEDNVAAGFSLGLGRIIDAMGVHVMSSKLIEFKMAAFDLTWLRNNVEHRVELVGGRRDGKAAFAALYRIGCGLLDENRLKLEVQPAFILAGGTAKMELSAGAAYLLHPDWTIRTAAVYASDTKDVRILFQIYFYKGLNL
ncbi:MAG: hypothetical protein PHI34_13955 [Acidobacteriota bacterium]|nr:hypothetical protein [Acidobacteriota bacterium]